MILENQRLEIPNLLINIKYKIKGEIGAACLGFYLGYK